MPEIVNKNTDNNKHQYAFNQFGQAVHINDAVKNQIEKYYYDENQMIEMIFKRGEKNIRHFALKANGEFEYNGKKIKSDSKNETPEHYNFKLKIYKDRFFNWKGYKIHIDFPRVEMVVENSGYRFDLKASLLDGTPIGIEIVKTSNLSDEKRTYLQKKQILTFIIFIDNYGNQKLKEFDIIGNRELEQLQEGLLKGKRECEKIRKLENEVYFNSDRQGKYYEREYESRIIDYKNGLEKEITGLEYEVFNAKTEYYHLSKRAGFVNESKVNDLSGKIGKAIQSLRRAKREIFDIKKTIGETILRIREAKQNIQNHNGILDFFINFHYKESIFLNPHTKIEDVNMFVKSHLSIVKANLGKRTFKPYYDRLYQLKQLIDKNETTRTTQNP
jgi:hypothetical protein